MSLTEFGQSVMANDLVKKTLTLKSLKGFSTDFEKAWTDMIMSKSQDEILEYANTPDVCAAAYKDFVAMDSTKRLMKRYLRKFTKALSATDIENLDGEMNKIFQSVGITKEQLDEMTKF